jgi:NADPH:quinone reductase-like Zn-dependent oxidoreductase
MMEVVMIDTFGSREVMKFRKIPIPTPGPNEILLKVKAAGINPVDWKIREGLYPVVKSDKLPYVLGSDVSGVVEARGSGTSGHHMDDEIYAMLGIDRGAYAEHVIVKANEGRAEAKIGRPPRSCRRATGRASRLAGAVQVWRAAGWSARRDPRRLRRRRPLCHPVREGEGCPRDHDRF